MAILRLLAAVVLLASMHPHTTTATVNFTEAVAVTSTAYDVLEQHDLPRGILPEGVQSYVLRPDGSMEVTFPGECDFFVAVAGQRYKLRYGATVGGFVEAGSVREVYGVRMQVKFAWLGLNGVRRSGDQLELQVGEDLAQSFPVADFAVSPRCV